MPVQTIKGESIVKSVFGGVLSDQGRGFYVALELFALLRGTLDSDASDILPAPESGPIRIRRRSHDFARRLMAQPPALSAEEREDLEDRETYETLRALARGLRVPIVGRRRRPPWYGEHFQPYVGELIHYDAVYRKARKNEKQEVLELGDERKRVSVERYLYRGAGGMAHMILRSDPDSDRLRRNRDGLRKLVEDSRTPLGRLFAALAERDKGNAEKGGMGGEFADGPEFESLEHLRPSVWAALLRDGVTRIVERTVHQAKRVDALMHWVPYCLARYQADLAFQDVGETSPHIPVDLGTGSGPIRRSSRSVHERTRSSIVAALEAKALAVAPDLVAPRRKRTWSDQCRGFFSGTMAAVGALNASTGKRHFVLKHEFLEALVLANLDLPEMPFDAFCEEILFKRLGLVVDRAAAVQSADLERLNRSDFEENAGRLAGRLETLGMLRVYSDQTRMVHAEGV